MYTGADPAKPSHPKGLLAYDVMKQLESLLEKGHAVYKNNSGSFISWNTCFLNSAAHRAGLNFSFMISSRQLGGITKMCTLFLLCIVTPSRQFVGKLTRKRRHRLPPDYSLLQQIYGWGRPCRLGHVLLLCGEKDNEMVENVLRRMHDQAKTNAL